MNLVGMPMEKFYRPLVVILLGICAVSSIIGNRSQSAEAGFATTVLNAANAEKQAINDQLKAYVLQLKAESDRLNAQNAHIGLLEREIREMRQRDNLKDKLIGKLIAPLAKSAGMR